MKIKSDGYFGKNIRFTCERCNCEYEVESKEDWEMNQILIPVEYGFKKIPEYNVICPKCNYKKYLGYQTTDAIDENGKEVLMTKDHIIPKSKGGADDISNYQTMCERCNEAKGNRLED